MQFLRNERYLRIAIAAVCITALSASASGQSAPVARSVVDAPLISFDVVSIRPNHSDTQKMSFSAPRNGDSISYTNYPLYYLVIFSNDFHRSDLVFGLPEWTKNERYDVIAKVAPDDVEKYHALPLKQRQGMFQEVLADRFKLRFHRETREVPALEMLVAKNGPKLKEANPNSPLGLRTKYGQSILLVARGDIQAEGAVMSDFAMFLTAINQGEQIVDKTGLTGKYDFTLRFTPDIDSGSNAVESGVLPTTADAPSLPTALREQLGIQLKPGKAMLECFVADYIEKPSEN
jgi:uncharacterized protein (TIGR03435 family)